MGRSQNRASYLLVGPHQRRKGSNSLWEGVFKINCTSAHAPRTTRPPGFVTGLQTLPLSSEHGTYKTVKARSSRGRPESIPTTFLDLIGGEILIANTI